MHSDDEQERDDGYEGFLQRGVGGSQQHDGVPSRANDVEEGDSK
eukprot:CAMPEP_0115714280 /NCGR_PEP_ID=MMETSP0272-20121206/75149_1 /TAXON_ID=71861 /ORGANISM="Scrippsiella trochoidea, Strain CCMP3099" /LENGTH=43 /DNA_ID= /DNA_START= /DNA_END= /DNA_ORIENTATION=